LEKATELRISRGRSLVLDPLEDLFPMYGDVFWSIDPDTNLRAVHAKDRHNDVGTDPNGFANSPRKHQHVRFLACPETTIIAAIPIRRVGSIGLSLHSFALRSPWGKFIPSPPTAAAAPPQGFAGVGSFSEFAGW
jgi:hypothetical protein